MFNDNIAEIMKAIGPEKLREIAGLMDQEQYSDISNKQDDYVPPQESPTVEINVHNPVVNVEPEQLNIQPSCSRTGKYYLKWIVSDGKPGVLSMNDKIHPDTPRLSTESAYVGPLCEHELAFFSGQPGYDYSSYWRFDLKERNGKKAK